VLRPEFDEMRALPLEREAVAKDKGGHEKAMNEPARGNDATSETLANLVFELALLTLAEALPGDEDEGLVGFTRGEDS
jgi:hypothetical protein